MENDQTFLSELEEIIEFEKDFNVVCIATNHREAVEMVKTCNPEIVLLSLNLSDLPVDGILIAFDILDCSDCKLIMLSPYEDEQLIIQSFTAGAVNYINKNNYKYLPNAIRTASSEVNPFNILIDQFSKVNQELRLSALSNAEREVFHYLEVGYTRKQIQHKLHKSEGTVKNQINQLLKKLNASNTIEAIQNVRGKGIIGKWG